MNVCGLYYMRLAHYFLKMNSWDWVCSVLYIYIYIYIAKVLSKVFFLNQFVLQLQYIKVYFIPSLEIF